VTTYEPESRDAIEILSEDPHALAEREAVSRLLLGAGLISPDDLEVALFEYERTGDPIGDILVAHRAITEDVLVATLAQLHQMQRIDLTGMVPEPEVAASLPEPLARTHRALPLAIAQGSVLLAVARPLDGLALDEISTALDMPVRQLLANRSDLDQLLQYTHREHYADVARNALVRNAPEQSAHQVTTVAQKVFFILVALVALGALVVWPVPTLITLVAMASVLYVAVSGYKLALTLRALGRRLELGVTDDEIVSIDQRSLPIYTILIPLYKEGGIVRRLVRDLDALDYPRTRLDVKLLCEEDDVETIEMIRSLRLPPHFSLVVVPDSLPKTKPKACNYGLQLATGHYCVIFDAEDRPDPDQLKKAVIAFRGQPDNVVCVQAKLNHFNSRQNLLTSWFANEYSMHFELVLPAMAADGDPIPLGGTSNHFLTSTLRELGGWDPFNVTEDADLGIRLHRSGYRTTVIDSTTLEEANSVVPNWIRQRSRWNKGYFQTWLVHMRNPGKLLAETGVKGFLSLNLTLASAFVLLLNPIFWAMTTLFLVTRLHLIEQLFPGVVFYLASTMLFVGNFSFLYLNVAGSLQRGQFGLTRYALLSPLYWGLMSWAAWKGFIQLFTNPFYWEKTVHGLDEGDAS
jgi:glycosyltransferase XagB